MNSQNYYLLLEILVSHLNVFQQLRSSPVLVDLSQYAFLLFLYHSNAIVQLLHLLLDLLSVSSYLSYRVRVVNGYGLRLGRTHFFAHLLVHRARLPQWRLSPLLSSTVEDASTFVVQRPSV